MSRDPGAERLNLSSDDEGSGDEKEVYPVLGLNLDSDDEDEGLNVSSDDESGDSESGKEAWPSLRVSTSPPLMKVLKMTPKEARVQNYHDAVRVPELGVRDMVGNAVWDQFERSFIQRIPLAQGNGSTIGYQGWVGVFNRGPVPFPGPVTLLDKRYELFECTRAWVLLASVNKGFRRVIRERYMKLMAEVESQFAMDEAEYSEAVMRYINSHPNDDIYSLSKDEREARVGMKKPGMNHPMDIVIHEIDKAGMKYIVAANVDDKYGGWYSPWENTMKVSLSTHLGWGEAQSGDLYGRLKKLIYQGRYKVSHMCFLSTIMPLECSVCKKKKYKSMMDTMDPCVIWGSIMARVCHECQRSSWRELTSVCIMYNIHTVGFSRDIKKVKVDIGAKSKLLKEIDPMSPLADKPGKKTVYFVHMPSLIKHLGGEEKADERAMKAKMWRGAMLRMVERIRTKRCVERWEEYLDWFNNPPIHGKPTMQWEKLLKKYNEDRHVNKVLTIKSLLKKTKDSNFYPGLKGVPVRFCPISKMIDDRKKDIIVIDD